MNFDANKTSLTNSGIFGLPFSKEQALLQIIPVPWEVTTSYRGGTSLAPKAILEESAQLDLFDTDWKNSWEAGVFLDQEMHDDILTESKLHKIRAQYIIDALETSGGLTVSLSNQQEEVNRAAERLNKKLFARAKSALTEDKFVAFLGGDHSTPYGLIKAVDDKYFENGFGILHIDAHADLRDAYQGFTHSHASIMKNVLADCQRLKKLVQIGIRDFCEEEFDLINSDDRIQCFFQKDISNRLFTGETWASIVDEAVDALPETVYISCDIDGFIPKLCPNTGTPVPGGISYEQFTFLLRKVVEKGKKIVGFDLSEVSPGPEGNSQFDAIVGARVLFQLSSALLHSQKA